MITHIYKLIWNKKKQNFLLLLEIFISFLVLFVTIFNIIGFYTLYTTPRGFDYKNVWSVNYGLPSGLNSRDSIAGQINILKKMILSMPQVENVCFSSNNIPYSNNEISNAVSYKGKDQSATLYLTDKEYSRVLNMQMLSGNWAPAHRKGYSGVVINKMLKEKLFGTQNPIGQVITMGSDKLIVNGVAENTKLTGDYRSLESIVFKILDSLDRDENYMLIKVRPSADAAFEARLYKTMSNFSKNANIEIEHLEKKRITKNNFMIIPFSIIFLVVGFLIINVALGIFGVLWYNINRRKSEIGLRRAVGASGSEISRQVITEGLVLSTISLIAGTFFAIQFPLLNVDDIASEVYLKAIAFSVVFIYVLVVICSLYPARQAAYIYPSTALQED